MTSVFGKGSHEITDSDKRFDVRVSLPFPLRTMQSLAVFRTKRKREKNRKIKSKNPEERELCFLNRLEECRWLVI